MTSISSLSVIILAVVKYIKIAKFSTFDDIITRNRIRFMIAMSWFIPVPLLSSYLFDKNQRWTMYSASLSITIATMISLPVFSFLILYVFKKSRDHVNRMTNSIYQRESNNQTTEQISKKLVQRSLWLIGVYFMCTAVTIISFVVLELGFVRQGYFYQATAIIFLGNSCANPCIYMYKDHKMRKIAKKLFETSVIVSESLSLRQTYISS